MHEPEPVLLPALHGNFNLISPTSHFHFPHLLTSLFLLNSLQRNSTMPSLAASAAAVAANAAGDGMDIASLAKASAAELRIDYQDLAEIAYTGGLIQGALPEAVLQRSSLLALGLQRAGMSLLPVISHLRLLVALDISCNFLVALPASISELQRLELIDCSDNKLQALPSSLYTLTSLKKLIAYKNSIERLDEAVNHLMRLEELNL